jgi:tryptophan 2,3-dioxygenase
MIRDLTKSLLSFSWGMSLFGAQQVANLLTPQSPSQPAHTAMAAFNVVTQTVEGQFSEALKGVFKAGEQLQQGMVDLSFSFFTLEAFNPNRMMHMTSEVMQQTSGAFRQGMPEGSLGTQQESSGWGPVPPAN